MVQGWVRKTTLQQRVRVEGVWALIVLCGHSSRVCSPSVCSQHVGATHPLVSRMSRRSWFTGLTWYTGFPIITSRAPLSLERETEGEAGADSLVLKPLRNYDTHSLFCGCSCRDFLLGLLKTEMWIDPKTLCLIQDVQWNLSFPCDKNDAASFFYEPLAVKWRTVSYVPINHPQNAGL